MGWRGVYFYFLLFLSSSDAYRTLASPFGRPYFVVHAHVGPRRGIEAFKEWSWGRDT